VASTVNLATDPEQGNAAMVSAEELRAESRRLRETIKNVNHPALKQERAARALALAERAEAIANSSEDPDIFSANIERYRRMLSTGVNSKAQKQIIEETLNDAVEMLREITGTR
jgi:septal ring factor EnvC (AmiA/AmiB activator)